MPLNWDSMANRTFVADKGYEKELADVAKRGKQLDKQMAKKIIDDKKNETFVNKAWKDYQKAQSASKKSSGKKSVKRK